MSQSLAWAVLLLWIVLPLLHVVFSPLGGSWTPLKGSKCPFGPRMGWLVIVLLSGLIGWALFLRSRRDPPK